VSFDVRAVYEIEYDEQIQNFPHSGIHVDELLIFDYPNSAGYFAGRFK
jgi:hypothetical protein